MRPSRVAIAIGLVVAPLSAQPAPAPLPAPLADIAAYREAVARADLDEAGRITDRLIDARRPADAVLRTDPLLNAMVGMLLVERGTIREGRTFLHQATPSALPDGLRADALFSLALAQELMGDWRAAGGTLSLLGAERLDADAQRRLVYARGRVALVENPGGVPAIVQSALTAATRPRDGWEGEMIVATAHALTGAFAESRAAADRAWAASADAPTRDHAPMRVALLRAALAPDRDARIAMLGVAGAPAHEVNGNLSSLLPLCGAGTLPTDYVTFAAFAVSGRANSYLPVRASRPSIIPTFHAALAGRILFATGANSAGGTLLTLRCRTLVSSTYDVAPPPIRPWEEWFAQKGLYPSVANDPEVEAINGFSAKLIELEKRYGTDSPRLLPVLSDLATRLAARAMIEPDVDKAGIRQMQTRFQEIMRAAGAPASFLPTQAELETGRAIAASNDPARAAAGARRLAAASVERMPLTVAYSDAIAWFAQDTELPFAEKRRVIEQLIARFADRPDDLRRRALLVRLADLDRAEGKTADAVRRMKAAGAAPNQCEALADPPKLQIDKLVSDKDYPRDLVAVELQGTTAFELDIGPDGRRASHRVLLSSPGDLFDDVAAQVLVRADFETLTSTVKPRACTAYVSRVRWKLEDTNEAPDTIDVLPDVDQGPSV